MLLGDADIDERYECKQSLRFIFQNFKSSYLFKNFSESSILEATDHRFGSILILLDAQVVLWCWRGCRLDRNIARRDKQGDKPEAIST